MVHRITVKQVINMQTPQVVNKYQGEPLAACLGVVNGGRKLSRNMRLGAFGDWLWLSEGQRFPSFDVLSGVRFCEESLDVASVSR
jgi:hypothetical protein